MDHSDYAKKYGNPYGDDRVEKIERMAKQIVDARHVEAQSGAYVGMAYQADPTSLGGEIGVFGYPTSWMSGRVGLAGVLGTSRKNAFGGLNVGARIQPPSRLAPFVGLGAFVGSDDYDCDCDHDEVLGALYPELGAHFWIDGHTRLTASAAHYFTDGGPKPNFWFYGLQLGVLR